MFREHMKVMLSTAYLFVVYLLVSSGSFNSSLRPPETCFKVIFWLGYFNSCLNPIIYSCYSRDFKQVLLLLILMILLLMRLLLLQQLLTCVWFCVFRPSSGSSAVVGRGSVRAGRRTTTTAAIRAPTPRPI